MGETEAAVVVSKVLDYSPPSSNVTDLNNTELLTSVEPLDEKFENLGLEKIQSENFEEKTTALVDEQKNGKSQHPLRPGESDCAHYIRTGTCRYGLNCRYNHPPSIKKQVVKEKEKEKDGFNERPWQNIRLEKKQNDNWEEKTFEEEENNGWSQHPLRPGEPDCGHYLRTGTCRYGSNCRYNHPIRSKKQGRSSSYSPEPDEEKEKEKEGNEETPGQVECKYYLRPGGCKYGTSCRFQHTQGKTFVAPTLDLNFLGLPVRPGERECPFYMRNGSCKFATNCRFHHPNPADLGGLDPRSTYQNSGSSPLHSSGLSQPAVPSWSLPRSSNEMMVPYMDASPSYAPLISAPQGAHPNMEWNGYLNHMYPHSANMGPPVASVLSGPTKKADGFTHYQQQMPVDEYPERPGEKECEYFLRNGDCKFKSNCKFHHPKNRAPKCVLSPIGLPLRPEEMTCSYYSRYGICKFGPACKYDHPPNAGSSALGGARTGGRRNANQALLIQQSV